MGFVHSYAVSVSSPQVSVLIPELIMGENLGFHPNWIPVGHNAQLSSSKWKHEIWSFVGPTIPQRNDVASIWPQLVSNYFHRRCPIISFGMIAVILGSPITSGVKGWRRFTSCGINTIQGTSQFLIYCSCIDPQTLIGVGKKIWTEGTRLIFRMRILIAMLLRALGNFVAMLLHELRMRSLLLC